MWDVACNLTFKTLQELMVEASLLGLKIEDETHPLKP